MHAAEVIELSPRACRWCPNRRMAATAGDPPPRYGRAARCPGQTGLEAGARTCPDQSPREAARSTHGAVRGTAIAHFPRPSW